jgi:hypothetical protein
MMQQHAKRSHQTEPPIASAPGVPVVAPGHLNFLSPPRMQNKLNPRSPMQKENKPTLSCRTATLPGRSVSARFWRRLMATAIPVIALLAFCSIAAAQRVQLVTYDSTPWRYLTNKVDPALTPADVWTTPGFNDSAWATGFGIFGQEPTATLYTAPQANFVSCQCPFQTFITSPNGGGPVSTYLRTYINWTNPITGSVQFTFTNYVDDGMVVYLNGVELFAYNMPTRPVPWNAATLPNAANPLGEGVPFVTNVFPANLVQGTNVLAVQYQQHGSGSSDNVFNLSLWAQPPTPVQITAQPTNRTVSAGRAVNIAVSVTGTAPFFQWYKDNTAITDATNAVLTFTNTVIEDTADYFVVITNVLNAATSQVARLTVVEDTNGPVLLSAKADDSFRRIVLTWDEPVNAGAAVEAGNYILLDSSANQVTILGVTANGSNVVLQTPALTEGSEYSLEIGYQTDLVGNPTLPVGTPTDDPNGIVTNVFTWVISPNLTRFQAYLGLPSGQPISSFVAMPIYPNSPSFEFYTNVANWPQSVPNLEQYAMRFSGLFVAPETGTYMFNPAHDDDARFRIYASDDPNGTFVETAPGCCTGLLDGPTLDVSLSAGQRYYYELIVREFGGGDYAGFSVVLPSGVTNSPASGSLLAVAIDPAIRPNAGIAIQPQPQTIEENHTATFSVLLTNTGGNVAYQWQVDTGSGFTDIPGALQSSYTTPVQPIGNNGHQYRVIAYMPALVITSSTAGLTVQTDATAPLVQRASGTRDLNVVRITFNELMDAASVGNAANYSITDTNGANPLTLGTATLSSDGRTVIIPTSAQTPGTVYRVSVQGVTDLKGNPMASTNLTFQAWVLSRGFVLFEVYATGGGNTVPELTNNVNYPNNPREIRYLTTFDTDTAWTVVNNDASREGYGGRVSGFFLAPETTNYVFYMRTDDLGMLSQNTTSNALISRANTACCEAFALQPLTNSLVAGGSYYTELLYKEGTGGDYGAVAFKYQGDPRDPNSLTPVSGALFASLADPAGASVTVTQQPASVAIQPGTNTTLRVRAAGVISSGQAPIAYQWQRLVNGTWTDIMNANSSNYVTGTLTASDSGAQFRALVFVPGASTVSDAATVTVGDAAPRLAVQRQGNSIVVSWPASATGYVLESAPTIPSATWTPAGGVSTVGDQNVVTIPIGSSGNLFVRLRK